MIQTRVTPDERARIQRAADLAGHTVSTWSRRVLLEHAASPAEQTIVTNDAIQKLADEADAGHDMAHHWDNAGGARGSEGELASSAVTAAVVSGGCPMDVPVGVKCKACGKVHTPKGKR